MREIVSVLVLLLGLLTTAHARLDETRAETTARFGKPWANSDGPEKQWMYKKGGFNIVVTYLDGRVGEETYLRWGPGNFLSPDDEKAFLQANSGNQQSWIPAKGEAGLWQRSDGAIAKEFSLGDGKVMSLTFTSKRFLDAQARAKAEAEKENHPPIDRSGF